MASLLTSTCWPTRFFAKWLATFFGAALVGVGWGLTHKPPPPKPLPVKQAPSLKNVQLLLRAVEVYPDGSTRVNPDGTDALVPAQLSTGGIGTHAVKGSYQGKLSINPKRLTPISRLPGSRQWLIFTWHGQEYDMLIDPWPLSTIPETAPFRVNRPNPQSGGRGAAR